MIAVVVCPYGELVDDALEVLRVEDVGGHDAAVVAGHAGGARRPALARLLRATLRAARLAPAGTAAVIGIVALAQVPDPVRSQASRAGRGRVALHRAPPEQAAAPTYPPSTSRT